MKKKGPLCMSNIYIYIYIIIIIIIIFCILFFFSKYNSCFSKTHEMFKWTEIKFYLDTAIYINLYEYIIYWVRYKSGIYIVDFTL